MKVAIRVDASVNIGTGHVMRCLTLAECLKDKGADVYFISRVLDGDLTYFIEEKGFKCKVLDKPAIEVTLSEDDPVHAKWLEVSWLDDALETSNYLLKDKVDWLVIDHYGIDSRWHGQVRNLIESILVIDDLADRKLDCNMLLDQNFYLNITERYSHLVSKSCECLLGPEYSLLRKEFIDNTLLKSCDGLSEIKRLFVFMGGADTTNETEKILRAVEQINEPILKIDVVVSSVNTQANMIQKICASRENIDFHCDITNISELMQNADIAIGAGGATTLERCYLGLPSLVIMVADNQKETTLALHEIGALHCIGWYKDVSENEICHVLQSYIRHPRSAAEICRSAKEVMGVKSYSGVSGVVNKMLGY